MHIEETPELAPSEPVTDEVPEPDVTEPVPPAEDETPVDNEPDDDESDDLSPEEAATLEAQAAALDGDPDLTFDDEGPGYLLLDKNGDVVRRLPLDGPWGFELAKGQSVVRV